MEDERAIFAHNLRGGGPLAFEEAVVAFSPEALMRARQGRGLSREEASAILGIPRRTLVSWELGERTPPDETQLFLARKYHVELIDLHERQPVSAA